MNNITGILLKEFGPPSEQSIEYADLSLPDILPNQVLIKMKMAPINPSDIMLMEGLYGDKPDLPCIIGNSGVGIVDKIGLAVAGLKVGQAVVCPARLGNWCSSFIAEGAEVFPLPPGIDPEQAALISSNASTAVRLLSDFQKLNMGDWIAVNAGNSSLAHNIVQLAKARSVNTLVLVRDPKWSAPLMEIGATAVISDEDSFKDKLAELNHRAQINLGFNLSGGKQLKRLAKCMNKGGTIVTAGAMSREKFNVSLGSMIFNDITYKGFWMTDWYRHATAANKQTMLNELAAHIRSGVLHSPVEQVYRLDQAMEAITHAMREGRDGKILLRMS